MSDESENKAKNYNFIVYKGTIEYNFENSSSTDLKSASQHSHLVGGTRFSKMEAIVERPWAAAAPEWRKATHGLNLEGCCQNHSCKAYNKGRVIDKWGYRRDGNVEDGTFDFFRDEHLCKCPMCDNHFVPEICGFSNTWWKFKGCFKKKVGASSDKADSFWKYASDDVYTTFKDNAEDFAQWGKLKIMVSRKEPDKTHEKKVNTMFADLCNIKLQALRKIIKTV
ncbi:9654_t:CDS:2 [Paraglomus occultum]|uniref:9654_t:CDS:1 n=1 Tax=Paraglomus occultum TaxID=144539 RepID=A0A9N9G293_9GLOM|nr:9654_t:CDS:2 [Paraglomus occultum]